MVTFPNVAWPNGFNVDDCNIEDASLCTNPLSRNIFYYDQTENSKKTKILNESSDKFYKCRKRTFEVFIIRITWLVTGPQNMGCCNLTLK